MNTSLFISGLGIGFFAAFIILMLIIRGIKNNTANNTEDVREQNRLTLRALERRNEIGARQAAAMEAIQATLEKKNS